MKYAAWIGAAVLLLGSCSIYFGDDDDDVGVGADASWGGIDASWGGIDADGPRDCNPVAQSGCNSGEKCASFIDPMNPTMLKTQCTTTGSVAVGATCIKDNVTGQDDCVAGAWCDENATCSTICTVDPDGCPLGSACVRHGEVFLDRTNVGICEPTCSLFAQNCPAGEGCYLILTSGASVCARTSGVGLTQGESCQYLEQCARGYGCVLSESPTNSADLECAYFCNASAGGGNPSCTNGPGANFDCREIRSFYANASNVQADVGMCVDPVEWPAN